ncbi:hypothetical protein MKW98_005787 [Papaver atlanticum]|uniref:Uncharacterized protein n=1 Tax=Papaver atlanticum TaxID=357466 RepID=A0AAD4TI20_9MAGN|nr:hypothetical protein MKW98_005787 [Papaver atlanticum]
MSSTSSHLLLQNPSLRRPRISTTTAYAAPYKCTQSRIQVLAGLSSRRQSLLLLTASTVLTAIELSSAGSSSFSANAQDIGLFGIRKKLENVEKEAEVILENAEKGIENAEKGVENAEKELESAASSFSFGGGVGGLTQAGVVVGAEAVGVLVATSIVNGILGPESS